MKAPRFSIVIPVYNAAGYLRECLDSVREQTIADWEAICIDDGSSDDSGKILDEYAAKDVRFKIVHQKNAGVGVARNVGLMRAGGVILTWLDADDLFARDVLARVDRIFGETDPDMVRVRLVRFTCNEKVELTHSNPAYNVIESAGSIHDWARNTLTREGYCCTTFSKRNLLRHPFFDGVNNVEDALFMLANVWGMTRIVQCELVGYYYRATPVSITNHGTFCSTERLCFFKAFEKVCKLYGGADKRLSRMGWFNLVGWCLRPREIEVAGEIHAEFMRIVSQGGIRRKDLPFYARPAFALYCWLGLRQPITLVYGIISKISRVRDRILHGVN